MQLVWRAFWLQVSRTTSESQCCQNKQLGPTGRFLYTVILLPNRMCQRLISQLAVISCVWTQATRSYWTLAIDSNSIKAHSSSLFVFEHSYEMRKEIISSSDRCCKKEAWHTKISPFISCNFYKTNREKEKPIACLSFRGCVIQTLRIILMCLKLRAQFPISPVRVLCF